MMATYIATVNRLLSEKVAQIPEVVIYGENINTGSHLVGMTRNFKLERGGRILNVGNCEATHCGVGFGLMMGGATAVLFVKQLDFMLLGMDHFVNTYNFIRAHRERDTLGSFTIVVIVCNQGYQGPQSSFNALGDLCSLARVPGFMVTNQRDAESVIPREIGKPGFRFIALDQRLFPKEILSPDGVRAAEDSSVFQYSSGEDATIVCFNFSFPQGWTLQEKLAERGIKASLFSVNPVLSQDWDGIKESVLKTRRLVVLDDSKSINLLAYTLLHEVTRQIPSIQTVMLTRGLEVEFGVCSDQLQINYESVVQQLETGMAVARG
ncbi:MAG: hypothetical protein HY211_06020 [Candidatus Omnitrophica bacterium]|nr:hypothetical protein [Candidatus Omnitrophota bacterium]